MRGKILVAALSVGAVACAQQGKLAIRPLPTALAQGDRPVSFRVAEANGQFALGNVALALESYRKALREDPQSIDALVGRAACYDAFGRFDLSRRDYEDALALAPADTRLLGLFAASLMRQGLAEEAAAVQREMAARAGHSAPASSVTVALPVARAAPAETIALAAAVSPATPTPAPTAARSSATTTAPASRAAMAEAPTPVPAPAPAPTPVPAPVEFLPQAGIRLERLSLGEVALVTRIPPAASRPPKARAAENQSSLLRFAAAQPSSLRPFAPSQSAVRPILVLNAARSQGLAGRTRHYLAARGLGTALIGDAPRVLARTVIIAPPSERKRALRIARAFSITPLMRPGTRLTLLLGRDSVRPSLQRG
jgi:hypothetical protein